MAKSSPPCPCRPAETRRAVPGGAALAGRRYGRSSAACCARFDLLCRPGYLALIMTARRSNPLTEAARDRLRRRVRRMFAERGVYRPGPSRGRPAHPRHQEPVAWRVHTPMELPGGDDHPQVAPALAAGFTIVVRGSADTVSALALGELALPRRVPQRLQRVTGSATAIVSAPCQSGGAQLTFTARPRSDACCPPQCAPTLKRLRRTRWHAPFIVFDDAELDAAYRAIASSSATRSTCVCATGSWCRTGLDLFAENSGGGGA